MEGPVTVWIECLRKGQAVAAEGLWATYFRRMRGLAQRLLRGRVKRTCDGEDVAASAFRSFYQGARDGGFHGLRGRNDLWALLAALTSHKCVDRMRREGRVKRGGRAAAADPSALVCLAGPDDGLHHEAELADLRDRFLAALDACQDPMLRSIVQWKLEGQTVQAIAARLGCVRRTVERKLRLIRKIWEGATT